MSTANEIFGQSSGPLPEERLMAYLEGRLSPEEAHQVEAMLSEESMESDALEGLQGTSAEAAQQSIRRINAGLHGGLRKGRRRKGMTLDKWTLIAIALVLLLALAGYLVMHYMLRG